MSGSSAPAKALSWAPLRLPTQSMSSPTLKAPSPPPQPAAPTTMAARTQHQPTALRRIARHPQRVICVGQLPWKAADANRADHTRCSRVDLGHDTLERLGDPDAPRASGDARGAAPDVDQCEHVAAGRVEARDDIRDSARDPDAPGPNGD